MVSTASPARPFAGHNLDAYQANALRTAIVLPAKAMEYTCLGLSGEVGEIAGKVESWDLIKSSDDRDDAVAELGDVCWYLAAVAHTFKILLSDLEAHANEHAIAIAGATSPAGLALRMAKHSGEIANKTKKVIRDGRPMTGIRDFVHLQLSEMLGVLMVFSTIAGSDLDAVMQANVAKLADRLKRGTIGGDGDKR